MNKKKRLLTTLAVGTAAFAMLGIGNTVAKIEDSALSAAAETVAVTVTVGEEVTPYADLQSALDYANTQDSAKITLVADTVEGVSQWVYTNLTLDLAGKEINNISLSMSSQASNASLVIEDSSGNNAGRLTPISGVTFSAMYSGQVTINGGTFVGVGFSMLNAENTITVNGGIFEKYLSISAKVGAATVNDGVFEQGLFYLYGEGKIALKGGTYGKLDIRNGVIADVLADGYALKNSSMTYEKINKSYIYEDEYTIVEHTCVEEYLTNATQHWLGCACFRGEPTAEKENHTGGTATCTEKAVCTVCKEEYGGKPVGHKSDTASCTVKADCTVCGQEYGGEYTEHIGGEKTCTEKAVCERCEKEYGDEPVGHTGGEATCKRKARCEVCNKAYGERAEHKDENSDGKCDVCEEEVEVVETPSNGNEESEEGCGGNATGVTAGLLGTLGLAVVAVLIKKRKISS